jgi:hypothetical protein
MESCTVTGIMATWPDGEMVDNIRTLGGTLDHVQCYGAELSTERIFPIRV